MNHEKKVSKLTTPPDTVVHGEYEVNGEFALRVTSAATVGGIHRQEYVIEADYAGAEYTMMGTDQYTVNWGTYRFRKGLSFSGLTNQAFIELHIQLDGQVQAVRNTMGLDIHLEPGDTNLGFMPATYGTFELGQDSAGDVFEIHFSIPYFQALAERHPEVLGRFWEQVLHDDPFWLSQEQLRTTPAMRGIVEQIRARKHHHAASALLIESQVLSLLSLQLEQVSTSPARRNGTSLSRRDVDLMYEARDVLLRQMTAPPTLAELARAVGTNECKLKRGFRELFGTSPYAFLLERKLEKGRRLLLDTDCTIAEVAYRIGYSHPSHFTNAFRKQYGICPSDLR